MLVRIYNRKKQKISDQKETNPIYYFLENTFRQVSLKKLIQVNFPWWIIGGLSVAFLAFTNELLYQKFGILIPGPLLLLTIPVALSANKHGFKGGFFSSLIWVIYATYAEILSLYSAILELVPPEDVTFFVLNNLSYVLSNLIDASITIISGGIVVFTLAFLQAKQKEEKDRLAKALKIAKESYLEQNVARERETEEITVIQP
jgi:hypothetical protein